jgi:hypothetical protein
MKLAMLEKQISRFLEFGITTAEVRLGTYEEAKEMSLDMALKEIKSWTNERERGDVGDGEISVKPCLPQYWDGSSK